MAFSKSPGKLMRWGGGQGPDAPDWEDRLPEPAVSTGPPHWQVDDCSTVMATDSPKLSVLHLQDLDWGGLEGAVAAQPGFEE